MKVQRKSLSSVALGVILTGVAAFAQTSPAPAPVVSSFLVESVVPLTNIASVSQPVFPSGVVSGLQSNSLELRQQIKYTASTQTAN